MALDNWQILSFLLLCHSLKNEYTTIIKRNVDYIEFYTRIKYYTLYNIHYNAELIILILLIRKLRLKRMPLFTKLERGQDGIMTSERNLLKSVVSGLKVICQNLGFLLVN